MVALRFDEFEDDTRAAIMLATYRALCKHGYANLTIQRIGDEFEMSKSLLYHHYEGKDEILLEFLEYLLSRLQTETPFDDGRTPGSRLTAIIDHLLPADPDRETVSFVRAMVELRAQAAYDPAYRAHFTRTDRFFRERFSNILEDGIDTGAFAPHDTERVASMLVTLVTGSMVERVTVDDPDTDAIRAAIDSYVETETGHTFSA